MGSIHNSIQRVCELYAQRMKRYVYFNALLFYLFPLINFYNVMIPEKNIIRKNFNDRLITYYKNSN